MRRKKVLAAAFVALLLAAGSALAQDDIKADPVCERCGMDRGEFRTTRMLITYADGETVGTCSLRCAALDLRIHRGKDVREILVADYPTGDLVDAQTAAWVVQYNKPGVMTDRAKLAFRSNEGLERFLRKNAGARATWKEVLALATEELPSGSRDGSPPAGEVAGRQGQRVSSGCCCCCRCPDH